MPVFGFVPTSLFCIFWGFPVSLFYKSLSSFGFLSYCTDDGSHMIAKTFALSKVSLWLVYSSKKRYDHVFST